MALTVFLVIVGLLASAEARPERPRLHLGRGPDSHVVGGEEADDGQWPSLMSLEYFGTSGTWSHICGAVLYNNMYAITAAHCVYGYRVSDLRLLAGTLYRDNIGATNGQILPIVDFNIHPDFGPTLPGVPNNLAIIRLTGPADTTHPNIANSILPPDDTNDFYHRNCVVVGFGRTDSVSGGSMSNSIQWLQIPVINNTDCGNRFLGVEHSDIYDTQICVLSDPAGLGPCNGDAGGPLYCHLSEDDTSVDYLAGVISWNAMVSSNCNLQYPSVASRMSKYIEWINDNTP